MTSTYVLDPIDPKTAAELRREGGRRYVADSKPGFPCRQCLRDAEIDEALILVAYDPFDRGVDSAFRSSTPIFLHEQDCSRQLADDGLPHQLTARQLSVRAFDADAMMVEADVIDGTDLDAFLERFFAGEVIDYVHIHNADRGCWATTARRLS